MIQSFLSSANTILLQSLHWLVQRQRITKKLIVFLVDVALLIQSIWISYSLRIGQWVLWDSAVAKVLAGAILLMVPVFAIAGVYNVIFRYVGTGMMRTLVRAFVPYTIGMMAIFMFNSITDVPRTLGLLQPIVFFLLVAGTRIVARFFLLDLRGRKQSDGEARNVLVYGAGRHGQQLVSSMRSEPLMRVVGYVDDDERLRGQKLDGHRVHYTADLKDLVRREGVTDILLAMPKIGRRRRAEIIEQLEDLRVKVSILPPTTTIVEGHVSISDIKPLEIEDLLGRQPVQPNALLVARTIRGKCVLVTGAGGSIGTELCRQIAAAGVSKLVLLEISEVALYRIERTLSEMRAEDNVAAFDLVPILGSVTDYDTVAETIMRHGIHTIYHAAAYKHVPIVEENAIAAVRNNVFGTEVVSRAAAHCGVSDMILISTDKAVRPTNVMGATKRAAEQILQSRASRGGSPCYSMVRFGNVLGSSGSVVPLFRQQIVSGGPVTLTHREVRRYFMTIPEAASLVIQAGGLAKGGEVFVLDMGEQIKISELAETMIRLSGLSVKDDAHPDGDIEIVEVGLRPGEKLYEELLIGEDAQISAHPQIMMAHEGHLPQSRISELLERFSLTRSSAETVAILEEFVPEFDHRRDDLHGLAVAN